MKKAVFLSIFAVFVCMGAFGQQLTVVVAPFEVRSGFTKDEAEVFTEFFLSELAKTKTIKVLDQSQSTFKEITNRLLFQLSDWSDTNKVAELGKALNANAVVLGQMTNAFGSLYITARILDVNTTQILATSRMDLASTNEVIGKLPAFTSEIVKSLPKPPPPPKVTYSFGGKGPGNGIIFFTEGGQYMEVSGSLGKANWDEAVRVARDYRGGGFSDWRLPTRRELRLLSNTLIRNTVLTWTSEEENKRHAYYGSRGESDLKTSSKTIYVIRTFY